MGLSLVELPNLGKVDSDTPEAAAESVLLRRPELSSLDLRLVEEQPNPDSDVKVFKVMSEDESCGMVYAQREGKYWQAKVIHPIVPTPAMSLRLAKAGFADPARREQAIIDLRKIIMRHPMTPEAKEVKALLQALDTLTPQY